MIEIYDSETGVRMQFARDQDAHLYQNIRAKMSLERYEWIKSLRDEGVIAAHPDDGWVDREKNEILLANPYYMPNDGLSIGDVVALGRPDEYRLVRVTGRRIGLLSGPYYQFEQI